MAYSLSVVNGIPDSSVSYLDDVFLQKQDVSWDSRRLAIDGIILMYTNYNNDQDSFNAITNGLFCPHYLIASGGSTHPVNASRLTYPGQIFQLVSERYRAKFCGAGIFPYSGFVSSFNGAWKRIEPDRLTIGIAVVGKVGTPLLDDQITSLKSLIGEITGRVSSVTRIVGRRHVTYSDVLGNTLTQDPEVFSAGPNRIDFSDEETLGKFADSLLNQKMCWGDDGRIHVEINGSVGIL